MKSGTLTVLLDELAALRALEKRLPHAEAALLLITLERKLRILPGINAADKESLPLLLQRALDRNLIKISGGMDTVNRVREFRNALLHGNFEQAAKRKLDLETEIEKIYFLLQEI